MSNAIFAEIERRQAEITRLTQKGAWDSPLVCAARGYAVVKGPGKLGFADPDSRLTSTDDSKMSATFVITTTSRDRDGDVVLPLGCKETIDNYRHNPRVFFGHQSIPLPIGSARTPDGELSVKIVEEKVISTCYFHGKTPESNTIYGLVSERQLEAASIGFAPLRAERLSERSQMGKAHDSGHKGQAGWLFLQWDMLEWSIVGVPANSEAIAIGLGKKKLYGEKISPVFAALLKPYAAPLRKMVRGGWAGTKKKAIPSESNVFRVLLDKDQFKEEESAKKWLKANGYREPGKFIETFSAWEATWPGHCSGAGYVWNKSHPETGVEIDYCTARENFQEPPKESKQVAGVGTADPNPADRVVQALMLAKKRFPAVEDAVAWADTAGHDTSNLKERDDVWVFTQFPPDECTGQPSIAEVEQGIMAQVCTRTIEAAAEPEDERNPYDVPTHAGEIPPGELERNPYEARDMKTKKDSDLIDEKDDEEEEKAIGDDIARLDEAGQVKMDDDDLKDDEPDELKDDDAEMRPPGVKFLEELMDYMSLGKEIVERHLQTMEHPDTRELAMGLKDEINERVEQLTNFAGETYPEHKFAWAEPDADDSELKDEEEDNFGKQIRRRIRKAFDG